jgi:hypothetical protein
MARVRCDEERDMVVCRHDFGFCIDGVFGYRRVWDGIYGLDS